MKTQYDDSLAFDRRYLVIGILMYAISTFVALNLKDLCDIDRTYFIVFTTVYVSAVLIFSAVLYLIFLKNRFILSLISGGFIIILIFILGFSRTYFFYSSCTENRNIILSHSEVSGIVRNEPSTSDSGMSYNITLDAYSVSSEDDTYQFDKPPVVRLYISKDNLLATPNVGDSMSFKIKDSFMSDSAYKGGFDFSRFLLQEKIVFCGNSDEAEFISPLPSKRGLAAKLKTFGMSIRKHVLNCNNLYNYKDNQKALLGGILVGQTEDFSDELYAKYSRSGFIHIASVSGMHTSYLFHAIAILLGLFRFPKRGICLVAIPIMIIFASVSLFTPSVMRSVIMMTVFLLSSVFRRSNDSITALSVSALLLLIYNPFYLENCGAILSYSATLGILVYFPLLKNQMTSSVFKKRKSFLRTSLSARILKILPSSIRDFVLSSMALSVSAIIGISYFLAYFFGNFQFGGIIGNIIISPLTATAFIAGYLNSIIGLISKELAFFIGKFIINPCLFSINKVTEFFASGNFSMSVPSPPKSFFVVYLAICVFIYILLKPTEDKKTSE